MCVWDAIGSKGVGWKGGGVWWVGGLSHEGMEGRWEG